MHIYWGKWYELKNCSYESFILFIYGFCGEGKDVSALAIGAGVLARFTWR